MKSNTDACNAQMENTDTIEQLQDTLAATEKCRIAAETHAPELTKRCVSLEGKIQAINQELQKQMQANDSLRKAYKQAQDNAASNTHKAIAAIETLEGICGYLRGIIGKEGAK